MKPEKILTFRASSIGDCLMGKYLLHNVHAAFPEALCGIVVAGRAEMIRDLFGAYPWIEVLEVNRRKPSRAFHLWKRFRGSDLVVTQYAGKPGGTFSFPSKIVARVLARPGGLIGFADASNINRLLFDRILPFRKDRAVAQHERDVLMAAGIPVSLPYPSMEFIADGDILAKFGLEADRYIVVHFFAGGAGRGIELKKKKELVSAIAKRYSGMKIVLTGGPGDRDEAEEMMSGETTSVNLAGLVGLQELMNVIAHSKRVISVDTGVAHITAQLKKPLTVLRTCLGPNWWFNDQYGPDEPITVLENDQACADGHVFGDYPKCLNGITVTSVIESMR